MRCTTGAVTLALALAGLAAAATAQNVKDQLDLTAKAVETQRRVLVAGALPMTESEEKAFWPLYDHYEKERRAIEERSNRLVADFVTTGASLSDSQAKAMLAEALQVDEERLKLRRTLIGRLGRAIPPRKVVRFFQIENKLDSVVRADISKQIPLAP
jgi:cyanate lyase